MAIQQRNAERADLLVGDLGRNRGELHLSSVTCATNYNAAQESLILGTGGAGGITIQLPSASAPAPSNYGKTYIIKKVDAGVGAVTVTRAGADLVDGAVNLALAAQYDVVIITSDGAGNWHVVSAA